MLRYDFLPSDYHPMLLLLGEQGEMEGLAAALRDFAAAPRTVALDSLVPRHPASAVKVFLAPGEDGLRLGTSGQFTWRMTADHAEAFGALVSELAAPERSAGSEQLETGAPGEIPVKVSRGEFTDDFLVDRH